MSDRYFTPRSYSRLYWWIMTEGTYQPSVRGETVEIQNAHLALRNPRDRIITERWRKLNFPFAIAEWIGMMTGEDRVEFYSKFVKRYCEYSTDGIRVDGAYGPRVHGLYSTDDQDQVLQVIDLLTKDPTSRRAVISIYDSDDLFGAGGVNTPCTLSLQLMIRNERLDMIANMRSNDLIYGLSNDLITFTMIQEYIARQLDIEMGQYFHNAATLHIYTEQSNVIPGGEPRWTMLMNKMPKLSRDELWHLHDAYDLADDESPEVFDNQLEKLGELYSRNLANAARAWLTRDNIEESRKRYYAINDYTIRRVMAPWMLFKKTESED